MSARVIRLHPPAAGAGSGAQAAADFAEGAAARLAAFIREMPVKELALLVGADPRTARSWRTQPPGWRHFCAMVDVFGARFVEFVFGPALGAEDPMDIIARAQADLARAMRLLEEDRHDALRLSGADPAGAGGGGRALDGAAVGRPGRPVRRARLARQALARGAGAALAILVTVMGVVGDDDQSALRARHGRGGRPGVTRVVGKGVV
ncbi:MAG TPA: hypothetical protein VEB20_10425 [Azospirillaceae bacterium]|nr:hypothetical protein [Azospirillaceae bacterium]